MALGALLKVALGSMLKSSAKGALKAAVVGGAKKAITGGGKSGGKISKEPIWSSGTTESGEYLSSGDRKSIFRQSRRKIDSSSSLIPISRDLVPTTTDLVPTLINSLSSIPEDKLSAQLIGSNTGKTLEERVINNEKTIINNQKKIINNQKKITIIKKIVKTQQQPFGGGQLAEISAILQDIGNALALDFSNRISKEEAEIDGLREDRESRKRSGAEAGIERVKKIGSTLNKAFSKVIAPAKGLLGGILGFFSNLLQGWVADKGLKWLSKNGDKVVGFFEFITKNAGAILLTAAGGGTGLVYHTTKRALNKIFGPKMIDARTARTVSGKSMRTYTRRFGKDAAIQKFGKETLKKAGSKVNRSAATNLARNLTTKTLGKTGTRQLLRFSKNFISPIIKKIPYIGALIDFILNVFVFKEPLGKAAFKSIGAGLGLWLGGLIGTMIPIPFVGTALGAWLGGAALDALGGAIYDMIFGKNGPSVSDEQVEGESENENNANVESQINADYTKLIKNIANPNTGLNFSQNVKPTSDLKGRSKGGVEILDLGQINNVIDNSQEQFSTGTAIMESSLPSISATDESQRDQRTDIMDGLGID